MTIVPLTGADIARAFENGRRIRCVKLRYERGTIHGNSTYATETGGYLLMWIIAPLAHGLTAEDFHRILTHITELFPGKKVIWAYEEVNDKRRTEIILLTTL